MRLNLFAKRHRDTAEDTQAALARDCLVALANSTKGPVGSRRLPGGEANVYPAGSAREDLLLPNSYGGAAAAPLWHLMPSFPAGPEGQEYPLGVDQEQDFFPDIQWQDLPMYEVLALITLHNRLVSGRHSIKVRLAGEPIYDMDGHLTGHISVPRRYPQSLFASPAKRSDTGEPWHGATPDLRSEHFRLVERASRIIEDHTTGIPQLVAELESRRSLLAEAGRPEHEDAELARLTQELSERVRRHAEARYLLVESVLALDTALSESQRLARALEAERILAHTSPSTTSGGPLVDLEAMADDATLIRVWAGRVADLTSQSEASASTLYADTVQQPAPRPPNVRVGRREREEQPGARGRVERG